MGRPRGNAPLGRVRFLHLPPWASIVALGGAAVAAAWWALRARRSATRAIASVLALTVMASAGAVSALWYAIAAMGAR